MNKTFEILVIEALNSSQMTWTVDSHISLRVQFSLWIKKTLLEEQYQDKNKKIEKKKKNTENWWGRKFS